MAVHAPFNPRAGNNKVLTPAASSASVSIDKDAKALRLVNSGANICHVRIGAGTQTATVADTPVLSGESLIVTKSLHADTLAHISASGTTLHVQAGEGGI